MARDKVNPWLLVGLGGAALLLFMQRKTVMVYGSKALEFGKELIFKNSLSEWAQPYSDLILQVARETSVDPFLIYAFGERESGWGRYLDENMLGDNGHGHGLMQIDDGSFAEWLATHDWRDPGVNVRKGVSIYQTKLAEVVAAPSGSWNVNSALASKLGVPAGSYPALAVDSGRAPQAAVAAYNAGSGAVRRAYSAAVANGLEPLDVIDRATTGKDYSADVWSRMTNAAADFQNAA